MAFGSTSAQLGSHHGLHRNDDTFLQYSVYGEPELEDSKDNGFIDRNSSSKQTLIPLVNRSHSSRCTLSFKHCELILTHWIREHSQMIQSRALIWKYYSCIYSNAIPFALKSERLRVRWNVDPKSSILKLLNTKQTFMLHQDELREGRRRKSINFEQLNKWHHIELEEPLPNMERCNTVTFRIEIYQKFLDYKCHKEEHRALAPLNGKHKIGITTKECNGKVKRDFIGIMSSFNSNVHRQRYRKDKREGEMFIENGGHVTVLQNEIALRKHEVLEVKIDWLTNKMIFKRLNYNQSDNDSQKHHTTKDIVLNLNRKNMMQQEWRLNCSVCVNDIESFMWNLENDKDYISVTVKESYIA